MDNSLGQVLVIAVGVLLVSFCAAYGWTKKSLVRRAAPEIRPGTWIKLRGLNGTYRVRIEDASDGLMEFDAPTLGNVHQPLREGDSFFAEVPVSGGVIYFKTEIAARSNTAHRFAAVIPPDYSTQNRRDEPRTYYTEPVTAEINGERAVLIDSSAHGAKIVTAADASAGDMVRLSIGDQPDVLASVLEVIPDCLDGRQAFRLRLFFS